MKRNITDLLDRTCVYLATPVFLLLTAQSTLAATYNLPSDFDTIQVTINATSPGGVANQAFDTILVGLPVFHFFPRR